ncbi:MAG: ribulose 1,5-bisphosphate carboxylase [Deltaproteobacteria bacterium]|nr:ribulose 1,5-bisphosphate carboxylase [Deltaproteobacteria bacterium]
MVTDYDIPAFFAEWSQLDQPAYLRFLYEFVPTIDPRKAVAGLCAEQSTAMWQRVGVVEDLRERFGAKVIRLEPVGDVAQGRWLVEIAHPHRNFGARLPNLLVAAAGEGTFYAPGVAAITLLDITFPAGYLAEFAGPQFGLHGVREQLQIHERPFFIGVVKPNLGLSPADFAALAFEAWCGGLDMAKDDEMQADTSWSTLRGRVTCVSERRQRAEQLTGERKGFIANCIDEVDRIPEQCHIAERAGATAVMISPVWTGLSALRALRRVSGVPVMAHFAGVAVLTRRPQGGIASALLTRLMRIAGADMIGFAGFGDRMQTAPDEVRANIHACLEPLGAIAPALPIPGGSDSAQTLAHVAQQVGHVDFGFIAGRGVFGHAEGPRAGARSIREVWTQLHV